MNRQRRAAPTLSASPGTQDISAPKVGTQPHSPAEIQHDRGLVRAQRIRVGALVLAALFLVLQGTGIYGELSKRFVSREVYDRLNPETLVIAGVGPLGGELGFQAGDQLLAIHGKPISTVMGYRRALREFAPGATITIDVARDGETLTLPASIEGPPPALPLFLRNIVTFAFLAMGVLVLFQHPERRAARLFFLTALPLGLYFSLFRAELVPLIYVQIIALTMTPGMAILFFLSYPEERPFVRNRWSALLHLPGLVLMGLLIYTLAGSVARGTGKYAGPQYELLNNVAFGYLGISAAFGLASLAYVYTTTAQPVVKRQIQWIMVGLSCAVVVNVIDIILTILRLHTAETSVLLLLGLLPLPVTFGFSILRYRLLDIDLVLNRSVVYSLLTGTLAAIYLLLITLASTALGLATGSSGYTLLVFVSALIIGILVDPLRRRIQTVIDRHFFRQQVSFQQAIVRWSLELGTSLRFSHLGQLLLERVPEQMSISWAWLLVLNKDETTFEPLPAQTAGSQADPAPALDLSFSSRSGPAVNLARPGQILLLDGEGDKAQTLADQLPEAWGQADVRVVLPLVSGNSMVGVYLLGPKRSGDIYARQELDLLRALANQAAVAIANARLYEEVRAASRELEEKVRERTKELRNFVSAIYHELSAPMTAIRGYTDLLAAERAGPLTAKQTRCLTTTQRNIRRLMRLVADLSDISKIDDGRLTILAEPLDLQEAVGDTLEALSTLVSEKELEVAVQIEPESARVLGDPQRVVQILTNLVSNACRYTPVGGQITIAASRLDGVVETTIRDTGIGIQPDELDHVFERFYRSEDPLVQDQSGTGLGLAITKSLVELHGGRIWLKSKMGEGSIFGFTLPTSEEAVDGS